jgi:hypothetical protein
MQGQGAGSPELMGLWQILNQLATCGIGIVYMESNGTRATEIISTEIGVSPMWVTTNNMSTQVLEHKIYEVVVVW